MAARAGNGVESAMPVMLSMGIAGIGSSFLTAHLLKFLSSSLMLRVGFIGCACTAIIAPVLTDMIAWVADAFLIGLFLGVLTVSLASDLRSIAGRKNFALQVGFGTGLAYWLCNCPIVFAASQSLQALIAAIFCAACAIAVPRIAKQTSDEDLPSEQHIDGSANSIFIFIAMLIAFFSLIWLDSAAFFIIQQTTGLKTQTWSDDSQLWLNGGIHLCVAIFAGLMIDRGYLRSLLVVAYLALCFGVLSLRGSTELYVFAAPLYVAGVSIYSTALIAYPSLIGSLCQNMSRRWQAGILYGVAGWCGSAIGIVMAQDLHEVPLWLLAVTGFIVLCTGLKD